MASGPVSTTQLVQGYINSGGTANSVEQLVGQSPASENSSGVKVVTDDDYAHAGESSVGDLLADAESAENGGDTPKDSSPESVKVKTETNVPTDGKKASGKEVITVTDDKGKRKIEVDFGDKESLKKHIQMAYGARKWQAERDNALKTSKETESRLSELQSNWNQLEQIYQQGGIEQLVDVLEGRQGSYKARIKQEIDRAEFMKRASPDEIENLKAREDQVKQGRELERIRKENEEFKKQVVQEREQAELRSIESRVNPIFEKYRFAEKLGNPDNEQMFDEMLWNSALKRLEPYEQQGLDISQELVDREFRNVSNALRKSINMQAEKRASSAVEQKKQEATENVQAKVKSGYKTGGTAKEAADLIRSGNLTGLLKGWSKYGSVFRK